MPTTPVSPFRPHGLLLVAASAIAIALAVSPARAVSGFTEKTLAVPKGGQVESMACEVWRDPATGTTAAPAKGAIPPILFSRVNMEGDTFFKTGFALWQLGDSLRKSTKSAAPNTVFFPKQTGMGGGTIRYCLGRLAKGEGPSLLLSGGRGVLAYPSAYGNPEARGGLLKEEAFVQIVNAAFPDADPQRSSLYLAPFVFALDMNGDGKDEIIMPEAEEGRWTIYGGAEPGFYSDRSPLPLLKSASQFTFQADQPNVAGGLGIERRLAVTALNSAVSGMRLADANKDGRLDFMASRPDPESGNPRDMLFEIYYLKENGAFANKADQVIRYRRKEARTDWRDLNNDGYMDFIETRENFDPVSPLMSIEYYLAEGPATDIRDKEPPRPFRPRNPYGYVLMGDWDGDGDIDLAHTYVDKVFGSPKDMAEMLVGKYQTVQIWFFRFENGAYPERPTCQVALDIRNECLSPNLPSDMIMSVVDDLTGDGVPDFMVRRSPEELWVYQLNLAKGKISRNPDIRFDVADQGMPKVDEGGFAVATQIQNYPQVEDLDQDGRADVWWVDPKASVIRCHLQDEHKKGWLGWW